MPTITGLTKLPGGTAPLQGTWRARIHTDVAAAIDGDGTVRAGEERAKDTGSGATMTLPAGLYDFRFESTARVGGAPVELPRSGWYVFQVTGNTNWGAVMTTPAPLPLPETIQRAEAAADAAEASADDAEAAVAGMQSFEKRGTGSPEGVVTASPGIYYTDTAASQGAIRWVKASGSGATGWRVAVGDTGWRNVNALLDAFWSTVASSRRVLLKRTNDLVTLQGLVDVAAGQPVYGSIGTAKRLLDLPAGFVNTGYIMLGGGVAQLLGGLATVSTGGVIGRVDVVGMYPGSTQWVAGSYMTLECTYRTNDPWPTALPGTAA